MVKRLKNFHKAHIFYILLSILLITFSLIILIDIVAYGIKIAAVGDISCNKNGNSTIEQIINSKSQIVLFLGDLVYRDDPTCFFENTSPLEKSSKILVSIGNHDVGKDSQLRKQILQHYKLDPKGYYAYHFDDKNNQTGLVLVMDTQSQWKMGTEQYNFVKNQLEQSEKYKHKIIISHKNFVTCYCHHRPLADLYDTYHSLFAKYNVDLVMSGHNHNYQRFSPVDNVTYVVNGLGGVGQYELKPDHNRKIGFDNTFGYLVLDSNDKGIIGKFISHDNQVIDKFNLIS